MARKVSDAGINAVMSFAGRVETVKPQPIPTRVGGFGGAEGFAAYLKEHKITQVVDATHPFAAQMSRNALQACAAAGVPLAAFTRQPWLAVDGDRWTSVRSIPDAVAALNCPSRRVFLAVGRMHLPEFTVNPEHFYLLRLVDAPSKSLGFPKTEVIVARGPFALSDDLELLKRYQIDLVVSKNAGGSGARAKIDAARELGIEVLMIDRPDIPPRTELHDVEQVMGWLADQPTDLGV